MTHDNHTRTLSAAAAHASGHTDGYDEVPETADRDDYCVSCRALICASECPRWKPTPSLAVVSDALVAAMARRGAA